LSLIYIKRIIYTFFRTKIEKVGGGGANKKDNPKEIFYEFLNYLENKKGKSFSPPNFLKTGGGNPQKKIFSVRLIFKKSLTHTYFKKNEKINLIREL
jgi:hypothetical protein